MNGYHVPVVISKAFAPDAVAALQKKALQDGFTTQKCDA